MSDASPPRPPSFSGADTSGCALSHSKLSGNHQHQIKCTQLLAVIENFRAPVNNAYAINTLMLLTVIPHLLTVDIWLMTQ